MTDALRTPIIHNKKTGQTIAFVQTAQGNNGQCLEMVSTYRPGGREPRPHYHPQQREEFTIISGELTVRIKNELLLLRPGEQLNISPGEVHSMWNSSEENTVVNWKVIPALHTEDLFRTLTGLANDNKTNSDGIPGILQLSMTAAGFAAELRLASPPYFVSRLLFCMLKPIAYLKGLRATYKKYLS